MAARFEFAAITHLGSARANNEDCVAAGAWVGQEPMERPRRLAGELPVACLVADGVGGHAAGERASRLAATRLLELLKAISKEEVSAALRTVHDEIHAAMRSDPALLGMGTTVVGILAGRDELCIFNVGDSRLYQVEAKALRQLSVDHSVEKSWTAGSLFARSGMLTQCLGGAPLSRINPYVALGSAAPGATFLLCSDGLYETLDEAELRALITEDLEASVDAILRAALRRFCADNVTIALLRLA